jgi:hypothetical protein
MHGEILIAAYPSRADAERARDALLRLGVAAQDVGLSADVPTAAAAAADGRAVPAADVRSLDRFFEQGIPDYDRNRYGVDPDGNGQAIVAVRLPAGAANRDRVVDTLEACGALGLEGDSAATATETDFIEPEPAGWVSRRVDGMPISEPQPGPVASAPRPRVRSYPVPRSDDD